jgi:Na+/H+-dicarboxylate symporter
LTSPKQETINGTTLFWGLILGLLVGGIVALFKMPISGKVFRQQISKSVSATGQNLRSTMESVVPTDPVAESLAAGKEAARRRRADFGLSEPPPR